MGGSPVDCSWVDLLWPAGRGASAVCRRGRLLELFEKIGANLSSLLLVCGISKQQVRAKNQKLLIIFSP